ncbi:MAG: radical SAM protein, partial [Candidatus Bathyarchaeia archaeon]
MQPISPETLWNINLENLLSLLDSHALAQAPRTVRFYAPSFMYYKTHCYHVPPNLFSTLSVTGRACALNCKHCGGKILQTMHSANTPEKLFEAAVTLKRDGAEGCLISGGCRPDGSVPLKPFISSIAAIKRKLGLTVFVHTGIIDAETAVALKGAGVDAALIDVIGADETIKKVCNLKVGVQDYARSLLALQGAGLNFVPHIIVGLHDGELKGEYEALRLIAAVKPSAIVIIAFMPIHGTAMANTKPPAPIDIARVAAAARLMFPETPLVLGCMRPKAKHRAETDVLALKAGVNAIAFPSEEAIRYADTKGYVLSF